MCKRVCVGVVGEQVRACLRPSFRRSVCLSVRVKQEETQIDRHVISAEWQLVNHNNWEQLAGPISHTQLAETVNKLNTCVQSTGMTSAPLIRPSVRPAAVPGAYILSRKYQKMIDAKEKLWRNTVKWFFKAKPKSCQNSCSTEIGRLTFGAAWMTISRWKNPAKLQSERERQSRCGGFIRAAWIRRPSWNLIWPFLDY